MNDMMVFESLERGGIIGTLWHTTGNHGDAAETISNISLINWTTTDTEHFVSTNPSRYLKFVKDLRSKTKKAKRKLGTYWVASKLKCVGCPIVHLPNQYERSVRSWNDFDVSEATLLYPTNLLALAFSTYAPHLLLKQSRGAYGSRHRI